MSGSTHRRTRLALGAAALACLLAAPSAQAAWKITGKGWGHQIGMSQWGAFGYAQQGTGYKNILTHYYKGTAIGPVSSQRVRVLLRGGSKRYKFRRSNSACGRSLNPDNAYKAVRKSGQVLLRNSSGKTLANCGGKMIAEGAPGKDFGSKIRFLSESNSFRGDLEFSPRNSGGLRAVNGVGLDPYVKGVVPTEVPASWPGAALKAQSVAARSYGIATDKGKEHFDHYRDTRSQFYGGAEAETAATNAAVDATSLETVKHNGTVAVTYFHSTSGGKTEDISCAWGTSSVPYLQGVSDPYDNASPVHKWNVTLTGSQMRGRLAGLYSGTFKGITIVSKCKDVGGFSGRIYRAWVRGSSGSTKVSGNTLRDRLGTRSAWMSFAKT